MKHIGARIAVSTWQDVFHMMSAVLVVPFTCWLDVQSTSFDDCGELFDGTPVKSFSFVPSIGSLTIKCS